MAGGETGEKTEKASPKKRRDERKKGNTFTSKDLTTVVTLVVSFFALKLFITSFLLKMQENYRRQMLRAATLEVVTPSEVMQMAREAAVLFATTVLPVMLIVGAVGVLIVGLQTKFLFATESMKFKLERISFIKGFKRLFSVRSLVELLKSLIKIVLLTWLLYGKVKAALAYLPEMIDWEIYQAVVFVGDQIMALVVSVAIAFGAVAALDFLYQRYEYEKGIKMTKQEVKDEYKQMEGNPEIKSARMRKQREFAMQRMMQAVQEADVIVRNPTHFAVALKYTLDVDPAPMILAKGQDHVALRIVEEAEKYNIATVENKPLARSLYELGGIDEAIPAELYQPVAELLAWIYSTKEKENH